MHQITADNNAIMQIAEYAMLIAYMLVHANVLLPLKEPTKINQ
jgi:hypothetical protein